MKRTRTWRAAAVGMLAVVTIAAAACAPQAPSGKNWSFKGTDVTVNSSQDGVYDPFFGFCIAIPSCEDEPYLLTINFRVKIGQAGSAQVSVVNNRTDAPDNTAPGTTRNLATYNGGAHAPAGAPYTFSNVKALDLLDLASSSNKLEIMGTFVWASEEDSIGNGAAANSVANVFKDALNATIASSSLSNLDADFILDLILDNLGGAFVILGQNIPLFGFGDDVLGGGLYIGIGAKGTLGSALNSAIGSTPFPSIAIPLVSVPPDINGGGFYTMTGPKTFTQTFVGAGGSHTWVMQTGQA